jgi:hypothetical protein
MKGPDVDKMLKVKATNDIEEKKLKKEKISNAELEQMIRKFIKDTALVSKIKLENQGLKRKIDALIQNNDKFIELVNKLEEKSNKVEVKKEQDMIYSYQDGAMIKNEELGKQHLKLHKKKLTLNGINNQLAEILIKLEDKKK